MNSNHKWMVAVFGLVCAGVLGLGALYGAVAGVGVPDGMYFAVVTVTTVGYGDIIPHGWAPHLVALAIMVMIIPAWTSVFSLFVTGLITNHVDRRHAEMKAHVTDNTGGTP